MTPDSNQTKSRILGVLLGALDGVDKIVADCEAELGHFSLEVVQGSIAVGVGRNLDASIF